MYRVPASVVLKQTAAHIRVTRVSEVRPGARALGFLKLPAILGETAPETRASLPVLGSFLQGQEGVLSELKLRGSSEHASALQEPGLQPAKMHSDHFCQEVWSLPAEPSGAWPLISTSCSTSFQLVPNLGPS